ncbi:Serine/threonine-protein kinase stk11 [Irineochytrium annulatum]|nr:Serine/threonine-protein kinase stk11 [Irineochytrium annulatum]
MSSVHRGDDHTQEQQEGGGSADSTTGCGAPGAASSGVFPHRSSTASHHPIEKPTILLYPRKSVVPSSSLRDLAGRAAMYNSAANVRNSCSGGNLGNSSAGGSASAGGTGPSNASVAGSAPGASSSTGNVVTFEEPLLSSPGMNTSGKLPLALSRPSLSRNQQPGPNGAAPSPPPPNLPPSASGFGVHRVRSSWSVKSKTANVVSGMMSSRSMGSVRLLLESGPPVPPEESEPWEHQVEEIGSVASGLEKGGASSKKGSAAGGLDRVEEARAEESQELAPGPARLRTQLKDAESRPTSTVGPIDEGYLDNPDYYEYLLLCQRHASSNFIQKIDSSEVVYTTPETIVKMIGPYLLGDQIGKGAFGKVKEGICSETLQRVAVKIINKKRLRKTQHGVENVLREIKLLRRMKHKNIVTLIDVYCKVEDDEGNVGVFNWFSTIEDEPITWTYDDGTEVDRKVSVLKWYLVFEYCPCSLQMLLDQAEGHKLDSSQANK